MYSIIAVIFTICIYTIDKNGVLTANSLPSDKDTLKVTVTGEKDGVTVSQDISIVKEPAEQPGGKTVVLIGNIQGIVDGKTWAPDDNNTRMLYQGNGLYKINLKNVPANIYQ
jgi:hypothetical protein